MSIRTALSATLIIFALGLSFWLFVRPALSSEQAVITVKENELITPPTTEKSSSWFYVRVKEEAMEWSKVLANLSPLATVFIAWFLKRKNKH